MAAATVLVDPYRNEFRRCLDSLRSLRNRIEDSPLANEAQLDTCYRAIDALIDILEMDGGDTA